MRVDPKMNILVDRYFEERKLDTDKTRILNIDGVYYFPAYCGPFP